MNSRGDKILGVRLAPKGGDNQKIGEIVRGHPLYVLCGNENLVKSLLKWDPPGTYLER